MGRGSFANRGGGGGNQAQTGFVIDRDATKELNDAIEQMKPNLLGNFLMPEKKKVGKVADKLMNNGDILVIDASGTKTIYRKFDKGWWTQVFSNGNNDGSFDLGDIGGSIATFKNIAKFTVQKKQG